MNRYTFKAKRTDGRGWVEGNYVNYRDYKELENYLIYYRNGNPNDIFPETLCQCTGLQDIEGNYIFENDIVEMLDHSGNLIDTFKVVWNEEEISYQIVTLNNNHISFDAKCWLSNCKIIGNKFDKEEEE